MQLGFFANQQNALNLEQQVTGAGFDVQVLTIGQPGEQRYRVISGRAGSPSELEDLLRDIRDRTGHQGFVKRLPVPGERTGREPEPGRQASAVGRKVPAGDGEGERTDTSPAKATAPVEPSSEPVWAEPSPVSRVSFDVDTQAGDQGWVIQLGYFANLRNALNMKQQLTESGFEAQVLATGEAGDQRYRVISGRAANPGEVENLLRDIRERTGHQGFGVPAPDTEKLAAQEVFDVPRPRYLVAQTGAPTTLNPSPVSSIGYETGLAVTPQGEEFQTAGFTAGGMPIVPTIGLSLGYDDNITRASRDEISSWFYMISPAVLLEIPSDRSVLGFELGADIVRYQDSPVDDREVWWLRGAWAWDISTRQNLDLFAEYRDGADARGEGRRQGDIGLIPVDPDEWRQFGYGGSWDYGAVGTRGRLTLRALRYDLEYTNNRDGIGGFAGTSALDRDWNMFGGTFFWRIAPKTSLLADYQYTDMNYAENSSYDSEIHSWMLGLTWEASARTTGRIQYGDQDRNFSDPAREDYSGPVWIASVTWRPRTYSVFTLTGSRNSEEPNGFGDYVLRQDVSLAWTHDWATRFGTIVDVGYGEDDYRPDGRSDDIFYWGVAVRYVFNQHFRLGFSVTGYDRDSIIEEYEYQRMVYLLTLEASF